MLQGLMMEFEGQTYSPVLQINANILILKKIHRFRSPQNPRHLTT